MTPPAALPHNWPKERPVGVSVSVMLEGWTDDAAPGIGPMGNPLRAGVFDTQAKSWAEYGARTGAWRLLDVLEDTGAKAVFYVSGVLVERHPDLIQAIAQAGHPVAAHSWSQPIIPAYQTRREEHPQNLDVVALKWITAKEQVTESDICNIRAQKGN